MKGNILGYSKNYELKGSGIRGDLWSSKWKLAICVGDPPVREIVFISTEC